MPSKRTNDSVERILEELKQQQTADTVRSGTNDQQVNDILKDMGIDDTLGTSTVQLGPIPMEEIPSVELEGGKGNATGKFSFGAETDDFLKQLETEAHASASGREAVPIRSAKKLRPAVPAKQAARRRAAEAAAPRSASAEQLTEPRPEQPVQAEAPTAAHTGDLTQTGEIKHFLAQAMREDNNDSTAFIRRKEQFKNFFGTSVAVVPDENGHLHMQDKPQKHHGIFGKKEEVSGDTTDEFVPINVSLLSGKPAEGKDSELPQEPAAPAQEQPVQEQPAQEEMPAPRQDAPAPMLEKQVYEARRAGARPGKRKKKSGFWGSRGAGRKAAEDDTLIIPEPRGADAGTLTAAAFPEATRPETPQTGKPVESASAEAAPVVYHSKYAGHEKAGTAAPRTGSASESHTGEISLGGVAEPTLTETTLGFLREAVHPKKKRDTIEFMPGKKPHAPQPSEAPVQGFQPQEPVGEPVMTPNAKIQDVPVPTQDGAPASDVQTPKPTAQPDQSEQDIPERAAQNTTTGFSVRMDAVHPDEAAARSEADKGSTHSEGDTTSTGVFAAQLGAEQNDTLPDTTTFVRDIAQSINSGKAPADTASIRFAEAAARLTADPNEPAPMKKGYTRLGGTPEDEETGTGRPFENEAEGAPGGRDFEKAEDAPAVRRRLDMAVLQQTLAGIFSGAAALVLLYLGTAAIGDVLPMPAPLDPLIAPSALLGVCLLLLVAACGVCWKTIANGFVGLMGRPSPDIMPALAAVGAVLQLLLFLLDNAWYDPQKYCLFAGPAALLLCFNALGKSLDARTVRANFQLISSGVDHAAAYRLRDAQVVHTVSNGLGEAKPFVLVSRPTVLFKGFLSDSYSHRPTDKNQQQFAWALGVCALLGLVFNLAWTKNPGKAVSAMAGVLCLGVPLASTLLTALPAQLMQRSAARVGAVIPGWRDIRQLGCTNVVQITARDLFPASCIRLHGIKTFRKERIDVAIMYAASILVVGSTTLCDVFLGMIGGNRKLLRKVDDLKTFTGKGCVGWIDGERILVGNRELLEQYGVTPPPMEYEKRFAVKQRRAIYLAVSGNLFGMFLVGYAQDPDTASVLESLRRRGISLVVTSDDFNCDVALIETVYSLPTGSVKVLSAPETEALAPATAWLPESEGCMVHLGSFASFVGGLEAAAGAAEGARRAAVVLSASVFISCVLGVVMSLTGGIVALPLPAMVLYQVGWGVLALLFPFIQKY